MSSLADTLAYLDDIIAKVSPLVHNAPSEPVDAPLAIRTLAKGEGIPAGLIANIEAGWVPPQPEWCWLVERGKQPLGLLIAAPVQNMAYLMAVGTNAAANTPASAAATLMLLFRTALSEAAKRGYGAYFVHLDPSSPFGEKMLSMIRRMGGDRMVEQPGMVVIGAPTHLGGW